MRWRSKTSFCATKSSVVAIMHLDPYWKAVWVLCHDIQIQQLYGESRGQCGPSESKILLRLRSAFRRLQNCSFNRALVSPFELRWSWPGRREQWRGADTLIVFGLEDLWCWSSGRISYTVQSKPVNVDCLSHHLPCCCFLLILAHGCSYIANSCWKTASKITKTIVKYILANVCGWVLLSWFVLIQTPCLNCCHTNLRLHTHTHTHTPNNGTLIYSTGHRLLTL